VRAEGGEMEADDGEEEAVGRVVRSCKVGGSSEGIRATSMGGDGRFPAGFWEGSQARR
jgi:hypothetical protein